MKIILNHLHSKEKTSLAASSQKIGPSLITDKLPCQAGNTGKAEMEKKMMVMRWSKTHHGRMKWPALMTHIQLTNLSITPLNTAEGGGSRF